MECKEPLHSIDIETTARFTSKPGSGRSYGTVYLGESLLRSEANYVQRPPFTYRLKSIAMVGPRPFDLVGCR